MSTIMPESELTRKAVEWISNKLSESDAPISKYIDEASMRFNLSPKDVQIIERFFQEQ